MLGGNMKLSNLIGKQIYSLYETASIGTTCQAVYNKNHTKLLGFYFFDETEEEHYVKFSNIFGISDNLTIKNFNQISEHFPDQDMPSPFGKQIIDETGKSFGNLCDFELDEKGTITHYITTSNNVIPTQNILANNDYILFSTNIKLGNFKPKEKKVNAQSLDNIKVKILKIEEPSQQNAYYMPPKITISSQAFIGKTAKEDIFGKNNELLLKKNQSITPKTLEKIKQHNKINQLYYLCN